VGPLQIATSSPLASGPFGPELIRIATSATMSCTCSAWGSRESVGSHCLAQHPATSLALKISRRGFVWVEHATKEGRTQKNDTRYLVSCSFESPFTLFFSFPLFFCLFLCGLSLRDSLHVIYPGTGNTLSQGMIPASLIQHEPVHEACICSGPGLHLQLLFIRPAS
jgi:hypothetical protein